MALGSCVRSGVHARPRCGGQRAPRCRARPAGFGGTNTLHELKGCSCDLCGAEADSQTAEVVALDCSFNKCPPASGMYHQACLEKYLKSIKCER